MGRLFDAVATIILEPSIGRRPVAYEGELAQLLEERCDFNDCERYELSLIENGGDGLGGTRYWDWRPMIDRIVQEKKAGVPIGKMAMRFHRGLVAAILELTESYPDLPLTLSGGCWQNRVLVQLLQESEIEKERSVGWPGSVPVNDSGIAIGQTLAALSWHDSISQIDGELGVAKRCV
jgi:hydrogenase maturation protein HypF